MNERDRFAKLKREIGKLRTRKDKAAGSYESAMAILKREYKVETIDEGEKLLKRMESKTDKLQKEFDKAEKAFDQKWGDTLE